MDSVQIPTDQQDELIAAQALIKQLDERLQAAHAETIGVRALLNTASDRARAEAAEADLLAAERDAILGRAIAAETAHAQLTAQIAALSMQVVQADRNVSEAVLKRVEEAEHRIDILLATRAAQEARVQTLRTALLETLDANTARLTEDAALFTLAQRMAARRNLLGLLRRSGGARIAIVRGQAEALGVGKLLGEPALAGMLSRRTLLGLLRRSAASAEALVACMVMHAARESRRAAVEAVDAAQRA